jgi:hypothetical protein
MPLGSSDPGPCLQHRQLCFGHFSQTGYTKPLKSVSFLKKQKKKRPKPVWSEPILWHSTRTKFHANILIFFCPVRCPQMEWWRDKWGERLEILGTHTHTHTHTCHSTATSLIKTHTRSCPASFYCFLTKALRNINAFRIPVETCFF